MVRDSQLIHIVMWEPTDHQSAVPFEFRWSRELEQVARWKASLVGGSSSPLTVYSATLRVPTDGDFSTDDDITRSLRHILEQWSRDQRPPVDQALDGSIVFTPASP